MNLYDRKRLFRRLKRFRKYWQERLYYIFIDLIKDLKDEDILNHLTDQIIFENIILPYLYSLGIPSEQITYFLGYAKRHFYKKRKYVFSSLDSYQDVLSYEMKERELKEDAICPSLQYTREHPLKGLALINISGGYYLRHWYAPVPLTYLQIKPSYRVISPFLAKYIEDFTYVKPTYKIVGFGGKININKNEIAFAYILAGVILKLLENANDVNYISKIIGPCGKILKGFTYVKTAYKIVGFGARICINDNDIVFAYNLAGVVGKTLENTNDIVFNYYTRGLFVKLLEATNDVTFSYNLAGVLGKTLVYTNNVSFAYDLSGVLRNISENSNNIVFSYKLAGAYKQTCINENNVEFSYILGGSQTQTCENTNNVEFAYTT